MPKSLHWEVANEKADGKLEELIRAARAEGHSFDQIARTLLVDHGITVTSATIRNWSNELEIPDPHAGEYRAPSNRGVA